MAELNPYNFLFLDNSEAVKVAKQIFKRYDVDKVPGATDEHILGTIAYKLDTDTMSMADKQGWVDYSYLYRAALFTLYKFASDRLGAYRIVADDAKTIYKLNGVVFNTKGERPNMTMEFILESGAGTPKLELTIAYENRIDVNIPGIPVGESKAFVRLLNVAVNTFTIIYLPLKQLSPIRSIFDAIGKFEKSQSMKRTYKTVN